MMGWGVSVMQTIPEVQKLYQQQSVLTKVTKTFFRMEKWEVNGQKKYIYGIKKQTFLYS
jgi:hypothetical protein